MACKFLYKDKVYTRPEMLRLIATGGVSRPDATLAARQWIETTLGLDSSQIQEVRGLIENKSLGRVLRDGKILLSDLGDMNTAYEEAFHRVFRFTVSAQERADLLEEIKSRPYAKQRMEELRGLYPMLTEDQLLEEVLAKDFILFVQNNGQVSLPKAHLNIFEKIMKFLRGILGLDSKKTTIAEVYGSIITGRYKGAPSAAYYNGVADAVVSTIPLIYKYELVQNLTTRVFSTIVEENGISAVSDGRVDIAEALSAAVGSLIDNELADQYPDLAMLVADDFMDDNGDIRENSTLFAAVQSQLANIGFLVEGIVDEESQRIEDIDEVDAEDAPVIEKDRAFNKVSFEFDPRASIKKSSAILLNSIFDEQKVSAKLGILKPISYSESTGVLFHILNGVPADFDIVVAELQKHQHTYPWLGQVIAALGTIDNPSETPYDQLKLANDFVISFTKNMYTFNKGIIKKGRIQFINLASDNQTRAYATLWKGRVDLNTMDVPSLIYRLNAASTPLQIAEVLGFEEIEEKMIGLPLEDTGTETVGSKLVNIKNLVLEGLQAGVEISKLYNRQPEKFAKYEVRGSVLQLAKVVSMYGKPLDLMLLNAERKRIYAITLHNYQSQVIGTLNWIARSGQTIEERKELLARHLPHLNSTVLMDETTIRSEWLRNILNGISLKFEVFDGAQARKMLKTGSRIKNSDMLMFHINGLQEGRVFSFKHGDRSTLFLYKFDQPHSIPSRGLEGSMNAHVAKAIDYLDLELRKMQAFQKSKDLKSATNFGKRGTKSTLFPGLSQKDIAKVLKQKNWDRATLSRMFSQDIRTMLEKGRDATLAAMLKAKMDQAGRGSKSPVGVDEKTWAKYIENNPDGGAFQEIAANAFALQMFGYIEQTLLFTGDPGTYKNAVDFFKRIQMQSSTGTPMTTGRIVDAFLEKVNERDSFVFHNDPLTYSYGPLKVMGLQSEFVLYNDMSSSQSTPWLKDVFEKGLIQDYLSQGFSIEEATAKAQQQAAAHEESYKDYDENDGMSYMNIFFWREYEHRQSTWNEAKENTFQLELAVLGTKDLALTKVWVDPSDRFTVSAKEKPGYVQVYPFSSNSVKQELDLDWSHWFKTVFDYASMKKPQYTGPVYNSPSARTTEQVPLIGGRKTAYAVLMPSVIRGTNLDRLNETMLKTGVDTVHMISAAKYGTFERGALAPSSAYGLYDTNGGFNEEIEANAGAIVSYLDIAYQKDQLAIANQPKSSIKNSTQSSKIVFANLFAQGVPKDYTGSKPFAELTEDQKRSSSSIYTAYKNYESKLTALIHLRKGELEAELGNDKVKRLGEILKRNAQEKQEPQYIQESIDIFIQEEGLELLPNWSRIESLLYAVVTNGVLSVNRPGDGKAQFAVTMWESGAREKEGDSWKSSDALKFYSVETDESGNVTKVNPAECIIPLPPKMFSTLLRMSGETNLISAIDWYNKLPDDQKIVMKGLRIPNQQLSFNDVLRIAKFTSPTLQSFIVLPSEIVVKSDSDFDIDKQQLYMPSFDRNGKLIEYREEGDDFEASLNNELLAAEIELMLHPRNAHNLLAPSSTSWLKKDIFGEIVSTREGITREQALARRDEFVLKVKDDELLSLPVNVENGVKFLESKSNVGLVAKSIPDHSVGQTDNALIGQEVKIQDKEDDSWSDISSKLMFPSSGNGISGIFDVNGNNIMDRFSGLLSSQVDALKDNYAVAIQLTEQTLPIVVYLMRRGVSAEVAIKFVNVPLIAEFLEAQEINNSLMLFSDARLRVKNSALPAAVIYDKINVGAATFVQYEDAYNEGTGPDITEAEIDAALRERTPSAGQVKMLAAFTHLKRFNETYRLFTTDMSADTKPRRNRDSVISYRQNMEKLVESQLIPGMEHRKGFLKPFFEVQNMYDDVFGDLYIIPEEVIEIVATPLARNKSMEEMARIRSKVSNDFILFMLQNFNSEFRDKYTFENLFIGKNSVARQVLAARGDANLQYVVDHLLPMLNEVVDPISQSKVDVVKVAERGASVQQLNDLYEAFSMLSEDMQEKLIFLSLHQSGLSRSPFSLDVMINTEKLSGIVQSIKAGVLNLLESAPEQTIDTFQKLFYFNNPQFLPYSARDAKKGVGLTSNIDDVTNDYVISDLEGKQYYPLGTQYYLRYNVDTVVKERPSAALMMLTAEDPAETSTAKPKAEKAKNYRKKMFSTEGEPMPTIPVWLPQSDQEAVNEAKKKGLIDDSNC